MEFLRPTDAAPSGGRRREWNRTPPRPHRRPHFNWTSGSRTPASRSGLLHPMRCPVRISREGASIVARCAEFPACVGRGPGVAEALAGLRSEILFLLEACPCDQGAAPGLSFEVLAEPEIRPRELP